MADQLQLRGGTTNEHSTFTGALREVTVDTDKDTLIVHDAATAGGHPLLREDGSNSALSLGTAGTPSIKFTGDTNTGIYSPGADQVAISTGGTGRLFVDASGNVGVGAAPNVPFHVKTGTGGGATPNTFTKALLESSDRSYLEFSSAATGLGAILFSDDSASRGSIFYDHNDDHMRFGTTGTERLRITSDGKVGVGTSSPGQLLHLRNASNPAIQIDDTTNSQFIASITSAGSFGNNSTVGQLYLRGAAGIGFSGDNGTSTGMVFTSGNRLGIGTTSPTGLLQVSGQDTAINITTSVATLADMTNNTAQRVAFQGGNAELGLFKDSGGNFTYVLGTYNASTDIPLVFRTGNRNERARIDSSGRLGVGTSSPSSLLNLSGSAPKITLTSTSTNADSILDATSSFGSLWIGADENDEVASSQVVLAVDGSAKVSIKDTGNVGIGTTSPDVELHVHSTSQNPAVQITRGSVGSEYGYALYGADGATTAALRFFTVENGAGTGEKMRIDNSGRLLVGTSSSVYSGRKLQIVDDGTGIAEFASGRNDGFGPTISFTKSRGSTASPSIVSNGDSLGVITFDGYDGSTKRTGAEIRANVDGTPGSGDMPSRLVFSTTADGASSPTERMRINRVGTILTNSTGGCLEACTTLAASTSYYIYRGRHSATTGSPGTGTVSFTVLSNGNVQNTNNSYGAISDVKLKENIVDASSQWDDLKEIQVRNYNFKAETGQQTHTQLGVVAQEIELVSPGLVTESPDVDDEGNDLGTVTKSVNYSVLYMKAVKALQEAMERIETLEAKVAALEAN